MDFSACQASNLLPGRIALEPEVVFPLHLIPKDQPASLSHVRKTAGWGDTPTFPDDVHGGAATAALQQAG